MEQFSIRNSFIDHINQARTQPRDTAERIYDLLAPLYKGEELHHFKKTIQTVQGIQALNDLRSYMGRINSVDRLIMSDVLCRVAQKIAEEKGINGRTDHEHPQYIYERIAYESRVNGSIGQLIALRTESGQEAATYFLIDDELATRKRRRMLLDSKYKYIGVGTARHRQYDTITVVLLAEDLTEMRASMQESEPIDVREVGNGREVRDQAMGRSTANSHLNFYESRREPIREEYREQPLREEERYQ